jgi:hypothetical protein
MCISSHKLARAVHILCKTLKDDDISERSLWRRLTVVTLPTNSRNCKNAISSTTTTLQAPKRLAVIFETLRQKCLLFLFLVCKRQGPGRSGDAITSKDLAWLTCFMHKVDPPRLNKSFAKPFLFQRARICIETMSPDVARCNRIRSLRYVLVLQKYVYEADRRS